MMGPGEFAALIVMVLIAVVVASALAFGLFPESVAVPTFPGPSVSR